MAHDKNKVRTEICSALRKAGPHRDCGFAGRAATRPPVAPAAPQHVQPRRPVKNWQRNHVRACYSVYRDCNFRFNGFPPTLTTTGLPLAVSLPSFSRRCLSLPNAVVSAARLWRGADTVFHHMTCNGNSFQVLRTRPESRGVAWVVPANNNLSLLQEEGTPGVTGEGFWVDWRLSRSTR